MKAAVHALAAGARRTAATTVAAEAGLRLLATATGSGVFRWAPDPDAPALRELAPGEARLTIRSFTVDAAARRGSRWTGSVGGSAPGWTSIPATGLAEVTESRARLAPVGSWWTGLVHVGTHLVFRADQAPGIGLSAIAAVPAVTGRLDAAGRDEVERLILAWRDGGPGVVAPGPMTLTAFASSPSAARPISVASWHRPQAAPWNRGLSTAPRPM